MKQIKNTSSDRVQILKSATCPSLSNRSTLGYQIACCNGSDIQVRITTNSSAGSFNREFIDLQAIGSTLEKAPRGTAITSNALAPLFRGKSINNQLFLFAVLVHEGFVRRLEGEKRGYERVEVGEFVKRTQALIAGKGATADADAKTMVSKVKSAATTRRANISRKK